MQKITGQGRSQEQPEAFPVRCPRKERLWCPGCGKHQELRGRRMRCIKPK